MALFGSLSERLNHIFSKLTKRGKLTEMEIRTAMREVRVALLEADVNLRVAKQFIADVSEVESEADERALMEAINRFLRSLKDRECSIFIRRYFHAFSIGRIASMYDMTESAVSKTLARTREKLKKFLRSEGYIV